MEFQGLVERHVAAIRDAISLTLLDAKSVADAVAAVVVRLSSETSKDSARRTTELALSSAVLDFCPCSSGAGASGDLRAAFAVIDAATALFSRQLIAGETPPLLLQYVLLLAPKDQLLQCADAITETFDVMGRGHLASAGFVARLALTKAVVLFLRRGLVMEHAQLAGKIRKCLAAILPCWDTSGVNLKGAYNVENVTDFSAECENCADGATVGGVDPLSPPVDWALYRSFWGLQTYMGDPRRAETPQGWSELHSHICTVLAAFEATPVQFKPDPPSPETRWPKFLTSPALLRLQVTDSHFRRNVLIQYCVVLQHLRLHAAELRKDNPEKFDPWRSVFTSLSDQKSDFGDGDKLNDRIMVCLSSLDDGKAGGLSDFLKSCLDREAIWINWKNRGCYARNPAEDLPDQLRGTPLKPGRRPRTPVQKRTVPEYLADAAAASHAPDDILNRAWKRQRWDLDGRDEASDGRRGVAPGKRHLMSAEELTAEWLPLSYEERAKSLLLPENVFAVPGVEQYCEEVKKEAEDGHSDDVYPLWKNAAYMWKCMRALSAQRCDIFLDVANPDMQRAAPPFDLRRLIDVCHRVEDAAASTAKTETGTKELPRAKGEGIVVKTEDV